VSNNDDAKRRKSPYARALNTLPLPDCLSDIVRYRSKVDNRHFHSAECKQEVVEAKEILY